MSRSGNQMGLIFATKLYKELRSRYRPSLRRFVIAHENEKIKTLCKASEVDEKLFWKMLKEDGVQKNYLLNRK